MAFFAAVAAPMAGALVSSLLAPSGGQNAAAVAAADPFAAQRGQYQQMLQTMMTPGQQFNPLDPSYKFQVDQGNSALAAQQAKSGSTASGNAMLDAQKFGTNLAQSTYQQQFNNLAMLSGAQTGSPGTAGQLLQGQANNQQGAASSFGNIIGQGVGAVMGAPSATPVNPSTALTQQAFSAPTPTTFSQPTVDVNAATGGGVAPLFKY